MIYRYCVVANGAIDPYQNIEQHKIVVLCPQKPDLALLKVNKQVGKEAKTVLFGGNTAEDGELRAFSATYSAHRSLPSQLCLR